MLIYIQKGGRMLHHINSHETLQVDSPLIVIPPLEGVNFHNFQGSLGASSSVKPGEIKISLGEDLKGMFLDKSGGIVQTSNQTTSLIKVSAKPETIVNVRGITSGNPTFLKEHYSITPTMLIHLMMIGSGQSNPILGRNKHLFVVGDQMRQGRCCFVDVSPDFVTEIDPDLTQVTYWKVSSVNEPQLWRDSKFFVKVESPLGQKLLRSRFNSTPHK